MGHKALQELSTGVHVCLHYYVLFEDDLNCGNPNFRRSGNCNLSNCKLPKKISGLQRNSTLWPLR